MTGTLLVFRNIGMLCVDQSAQHASLLSLHALHSSAQMLTSFLMQRARPLDYTQIVSQLLTQPLPHTMPKADPKPKTPRPTPVAKPDTPSPLKKVKVNGVALTAAKALAKAPEPEATVPVTFVGTFRRKDSRFGRYEFFITESDYDKMLTDAANVLSEVEEEGQKFLKYDDYNSKHMIAGKPPKAEAKSFPVPEPGTAVKVSGNIALGTVRGDRKCWFVITDMAQATE